MPVVDLSRVDAARAIVVGQLPRTLKSRMRRRLAAVDIAMELRTVGWERRMGRMTRAKDLRWLWRESWMLQWNRVGGESWISTAFQRREGEGEVRSDRRLVGRQRGKAVGG